MTLLAAVVDPEWAAEWADAWKVTELLELAGSDVRDSQCDSLPEAQRRELLHEAAALRVLADLMPPRVV